MAINKYLPIYIVLLYFLVVYILFVFGPWPWPVDNLLLTTLFIMISHLSLYLGYVSSINKKRIYNITPKKYIINLSFMNLMKCLIIINIFTAIPLFLLRSGADLNFTSIINVVLEGLINPGEMYQKKLQNEMETASWLYLIVLVLNTLLKIIIIPNLIYYWEKFKPTIKLIAIFTLLIETFSWISIGTNKGIFDNVFIILFSILIKYLYNIRRIPKKYIIISIITSILSITYFINAIINRSGKLVTFNKFASIHINRESVFVKYVPESLGNLFIVMTSYLTQGYYGLSLGLKEKFISTWGFGSSWFLMNVYSLFKDRDSLENDSLIFRIQKYGWQPDINWHSIYTWLASDYSFWGVIIIMFVFGKLFANLVNDIKTNELIFSKSLLTLFFIMFMYFPMNNQIFSFIDTFFTFWFLFVFWFFNSKLAFIRFKGVEKNVS